MYNGSLIDVLDVDLGCLNACFSNSHVSNNNSSSNSSSVKNNLNGASLTTNYINTAHLQQYTTAVSSPNYVFSSNPNSSSHVYATTGYNNADDNCEGGTESVQLLASHHVEELNILKEDHEDDQTSLVKWGRI